MMHSIDGSHAAFAEWSYYLIGVYDDLTIGQFVCLPVGWVISGFR